MEIRAALTFILMCIPFLLLTVWALVDIAIKDFPSLKEKALWYIVALIPFIGWLFYLLFGFRRGRKPGRTRG
jgi:hypothetical protein